MLAMPHLRLIGRWTFGFGGDCHLNNFGVRRFAWTGGDRLDLRPALFASLPAIVKHMVR